MDTFYNTKHATSMVFFYSMTFQECKALVEIAKNYGKKVDLAFEAMIYRKMDFDEEVKDSHVIVICKQ